MTFANSKTEQFCLILALLFSLIGCDETQSTTPCSDCPSDCDTTIGRPSRCGAVGQDGGPFVDVGSLYDLSLDQALNIDLSVDLDGSVPDPVQLDDGISDMSRVDQMVPFPSVEPCKLPFSGGTGVGIGMPQPAIRMPATGTVKGTVLFVDFQDSPAELEPAEVFAMLSPDAEEMFGTMSYGTMNLELLPHLTWLRLAEDSPHYASGLTSFQGHRAFIEEAVLAADDAVDFSETDVVIVIASPSAQSIPYGPTWTGHNSAAIIADGRAITNAVTSGHDLLYWGSRWLNHELGHSMGLPDLYSFAGPYGYTRPFSLMDLINSEAPEFLAWERWQLGWIRDDQVRCDVLDEPIELTNIETPEGVKALVQTLDSNVRLVVESRRAIGFDSGLSTSGVVVSIVDVSARRGEGPISIQEPRLPLGAGESQSVRGYRVEVLSASDTQDRVMIVRDAN